MGLDLSVGIVKHESVDWWLVYNRLQFDRDYDLFDRIKRLDTRTIPETARVDWYSDEGIKSVTEDSYGSPLKYTRPIDWRVMLKPAGMTPWNKSVIEFLRSLPDPTPIILWWN